MTEGAGRPLLYQLPPVEAEPPDMRSAYVGSDIPHSNISSQHSEDWLPLFRQRRRVNPEEMEAAILTYCREDYRTTKEIAEALGRSKGTIQNHYLPRLLKKGQLVLRYPEQPRHSQQAYRAR
ncbi:hypothetical protein D3C86_1559050 [compost metagenome]